MQLLTQLLRSFTTQRNYRDSQIGNPKPVRTIQLCAPDFFNLQRADTITDPLARTYSKTFDTFVLPLAGGEQKRGSLVSAPSEARNYGLRSRKLA